MAIAHLVLSSELAQNIDTLNGRPITLDHPPVDNGSWGSANTPTPQTAIVGRVYRANMDNGRLVGEAWFCESCLNRAGADGQAVLARLNAGEVIETSLGWQSLGEDSRGVFGGDAYEAIDRNIMYDHLAVLLNGIGACSIKDGCGISRNEEMNENEIVLTDEQAESFFTRLMKFFNKEGVHMENHDEEREAPEADVNKLQSDIAALTDTARKLAESVKQLTVNQATLQGQLAANENAEHDKLVASLVSNEQCPLDDELLKGMTNDALRKMVNAYKPASYVGNGGSFGTVNNTDIDGVVWEAVENG